MTDWIELFPVHSPSPRWQYNASWDGSSIILFGGTSGSFGGPYADTWRWDGTDWTQLSPTHHPSARKASGIAWDAVRSEVVMFGGCPSHGGLDALNETWIWNGSDWTQRFPAHSPSARQWTFMAFDEANSKVVLFGGAADPLGAALNDTWLWNGTDWTQASPAHVPPIGGAGFIYFGALAYDHTTAKTVLYGAGGTGSRTWTWNGTDWTHESPTSEPVDFSSEPGLADWRIGGKLLQFGGGSGSGTPFKDETWTWDGDWEHIFPAHTPRARGDHRLVYDYTRKQIVLFGGLGDTGTGTVDLDDTWIYGTLLSGIIHLENLI